MSLLKEFAIKALKEGSDYFGETITGEVGKLQYIEAQNYYSLTVFLIEEWPIGSEPRPSTSGVEIKYVHYICLFIDNEHLI